MAWSVYLPGRIFGIVKRPSGMAELPRSFTVMGQKFAVDSWVTAKVVYDDALWDGKKVLASSADGITQLWDAATGKRLGSFQGPLLARFHNPPPAGEQRWHGHEL